MGSTPATADINLSALSGNNNIESYAALCNSVLGQTDGKNVITPEYFYSLQLLDTIRDASESYQYFKYAKPLPIEGKADKLTLRRWAPLQAHTTPLEEGIPPMSDKGSVEKYEISAGYQYGRFMQFTDLVDFRVVDPVVSMYTSEYSIVAVETLDLLARDMLMTCAQKYYAGGVASMTALTKVADATPALADFRLMGLAFKNAKVKPYDSTFHALVSPEFAYDMIDDPYVQNYMRITQNALGMYDGADKLAIPDFFGFSFHEVVNCPKSTAWLDSGKWYAIAYDEEGTFYVVEADDNKVSGYVKDTRTGKDASYIPNRVVFTQALTGNDGTSATVAKQNNKCFAITAEGAKGSKTSFTAIKNLKLWKVNHILVLGQDALVRTGISGEDSAKMYVKPLGSTGVLDPIDQRQSIGFKINNIGFGSTRLEAIIDYICVPTQTNLF